MTGHSQPRIYQQGVGLPAAIFVVTLLAVIAVAMNQLVSRGAETFDEEVLLTRAYYAAESGAGFAMNRLFPPAQYPDYTGTCDAGPIEYEFTVDGLSGCSASVTCTEDSVVDDVTYYSIRSTGICGDVSRTLLLRTSD